MIGQSIENYRIDELLGQGGMGAVYKALDTALDRVVALKVMNPMLATNKEFLSRFKSEARVLGRLQHPHIVNVYTFRHIDTHLFIVMEYVDGGTLSDLIDEKGAISVNEAMPLIRQSLLALEAAHNANIIHRDIKPPNILLTGDGVIKISDFGLAKIQEDSSATMVTRVGTTGGTLYYMPPEQSEALHKVDHRGDLYSLGMTLYQMLAGRVPFDRQSSALSILRAVDEQRIPSPVTFNPNIPVEMADIIMKAIKKYPEERFQTAEEMRLAIESFRQAASAPVDVPRTVILQPSDIPSFPDSPDKTAFISQGKKDATASSKRRHAPKKEKKEKPPVQPLRGSVAAAAQGKTGSGSFKKVYFGGAAVLLIGILYLGFSFFGADASVQPPAQSGSSLAETPSLAQNGQPPVAQPNELDESGNGLNGDTEEAQPSSSDEEVQNQPSVDTPASNADERESETVTPPQTAARRPSTTTSGTRPSVQPPPAEELKGNVKVVVRPYGDIYINNTRKAQGTNAAFNDALTPGTHTIRAAHPALGTWEKRVEITAGGSHEILFNFNQQITVTVVSDPRAAEIIVDGKPTGKYTPSNIVIPPGNHTFEVRKENFVMEGQAKKLLIERELADPIQFKLRQ